MLHQYSQQFGGTQSSIKKRPTPLTTSRPGSNTPDGLGVGDRTNSNVLPGIEPPTKKPRGRPSKDPEKQGSRSTRDDSWFSVRTLTSLILEQPLQDHLNINSAHDPEIFLNSCRELLAIPTQESAPNMDFLVRYCKTLNIMQGEQIVIHTQWLFLALAIGDMASGMFGQAMRMKKNHKDEFMKAAGPGEAASSSYATLTAGRNVAFICDQLGTGSLFWLSMTLTAHL